MSPRAFGLCLAVIVLWYLTQQKRMVILSVNSPARDLRKVVDASMIREDLDFIHHRERAKICRPVYHVMKNPNLMRDYERDNGYWETARITLRCDNAAEDAGFPLGGTRYYV